MQTHGSGPRATLGAIDEGFDVNNRLRRLWRHYRGARGLWHELLSVLVCLVIGVVVMPCLIFVAGRIALGPYANGGVFVLWRDFVAGLASGSEACWFIAVGPYLFLLLLRFGRQLLHN